MKLEWSKFAIRDQIRHLDWYSEVSQTVADRMSDKIFAQADLLEHFPRLGYAVAGEGMYHLHVPGTPFILVYRLDEVITIVRLHHAAQEWPGRF